MVALTLSRKLVLLTAIKLAALALTAIYFLFIAPHAGPEPGAMAMRDHLLSSPSRQEAR